MKLDGPAVAVLSQARYWPVRPASFASRVHSACAPIRPPIIPVCVLAVTNTRLDTGIGQLQVDQPHWAQQVCIIAGQASHGRVVPGRQPVSVMQVPQVQLALQVRRPVLQLPQASLALGAHVPWPMQAPQVQLGRQVRIPHMPQAIDVPAMQAPGQGFIMSGGRSSGSRRTVGRSIGSGMSWRRHVDGQRHVGRTSELPTPCPGRPIPPSRASRASPASGASPSISASIVQPGQSCLLLRRRPAPRPPAGRWPPPSAGLPTW